MTSRQHQDWINHGKPDNGLCLPLQLLANTLSAAGYTVYAFPNDAHLDSEPPEDHTPYSETGWPGTSPKWWRHAIDIMPPPAGRNLPSLQALGQRIHDDRQAGGITWLKYMNWPSDGNLNRAVHDSWKPGFSRSSSSDTGHIHISSTTGVETLDQAYNPLTNVILTGTKTPLPAPTPTEENPVFLAFQTGNNSNFFLCDGMRSRPITLAQVGDLKTLISEGLVPPVQRIDNPRGGWYEAAFGAVSQPATIDVAAVAAALAPLLPPGTTVDVAALAAALKPLLPSHLELTGAVT